MNQLLGIEILTARLSRAQFLPEFVDGFRRICQVRLRLPGICVVRVSFPFDEEQMLAVLFFELQDVFDFIFWGHGR